MSSKKRALDQDDASVDAASPPLDHGNSTSNFRNVSACNRCRNRKNRCDQKLPRCSGCEKAKVKCVGFDPVSRREIPRSYVYYLETRVNNLEALLKDHGITYPPPSEDFSISDTIKPGVNVPFPAQDDTHPAVKRPAVSTMDFSLDPALQEPDSPARLNHLVHDVGMVSVQGTSDARLQSSNPGTSSGIPFSRVVFAAVKSSVSHTPSERGTAKLSNQLPSETTSDNGGNSSFFALQTKPSVKPAPFPDKSVGDRLVELYFEHANPQIPILHRPQFMSLFDRIYNTEAKKRTARELYLMNIVFAIGSGIIMDSPSVEQSVSATDSAELSSEPSNTRRSGTVGQQSQPEEYHAAAIAHLDGFLGSPPATEGGGGGLEELQAVLLLAGLALLRPVAPGLWYIIGVAVRLAVDLGLHFENSDAELDNSEIDEEAISKTIGRKQWIRDLKRRLWWCTYSLDRLVSTCVGRPFGIVDQVITTPFPSLLDDTSIAPTGFLVATQIKGPPSYKLVAQHYFRLRLLQSEILQVLQHRHADSIRAANFPTTDASSQYMRAELSVPYMDGFGSFRDWRANVDHRLHEWKESAPKQFETGVAFEPLFLELNYWQAIIMLYRQSLAVPETLAAELSPATGESIPSPSALNLEAKEDEQMIFMKVAQAGQTVLKIYRQLHRLKLVNYTFLATHHLFMSGISFLYAIWHSSLVRSQLTLDDIDFTVLSATSVLTDLIEKCPPAEACRDAFERMSKATISMCINTTGFGNSSTLSTQSLSSPSDYFAESAPDPSASLNIPSLSTSGRTPMPKFDMHLKELFSEEEIANQSIHQQDRRLSYARPLYQQQQPSTSRPLSHTRFATRVDSRTSSTMQYPRLSSPGSEHSTSGSADDAQLHFITDPTAHHQQQQQQQQQAYTSAPAPTSSDTKFPFDDSLDFLDAFPAPSSTGRSDPASAWSTHAASELDLGFGTGGTAAAFETDEFMAWEANGGVDLFDGFFFGGGAAGAGNGNGHGHGGAFS